MDKIEKIKYLNKLIEVAVQNEDFEKAAKLKYELDSLESLSEEAKYTSEDNNTTSETPTDGLSNVLKNDIDKDKEDANAQSHQKEKDSRQESPSLKKEGIPDKPIDKEKSAEIDKLITELKRKADAQEKENARLTNLQQEKTLAAQKEKELELKRLDLELKKKEEQEKEQSEKRKSADAAQKVKEEKNRKHKEGYSNFLQWLTKKDNQGMTPLAWGLTLLIVGGLSIWALMKSGDREVRKSEAQKISVQLEKKYEQINSLITSGMIDSAKVLIPELVHPSTEISPYKPDGVLADYYSYTEYWQMKREELWKKIENGDTKKSVKTKNDNSIKDKNQKNISLNIDNIVQESPKPMNNLTPWDEMGISKEDYMQLIEDGY
jgi:hypothetical protein